MSITVENACSLSSRERESLMKIGSRGFDDEFDATIIASLLRKGFLEVRPNDRRLALTARGELAYAYMTGERFAG
jgi:hypothetical protein